MESRLTVHENLLPYIQHSYIGSLDFIQKQIHHYARSFRSACARARDWMQRIVARVWKRPNSTQNDAALRLAELDIFIDNYEDMIDILCAIAHQGVREDRIRKFQELRLTALKSYRRMQRQLKSYWASKGNNSETNPFQAILFCKSVESLVNSENGIEEISRAREALQAYRESLSTNSARAYPSREART